MRLHLSVPFKPTPLIITGVVLLAFICSSAVSMLSVSQASAQAATFETETDPATLMKAIKYYNDLVYCSAQFKKSISGTDITNGPRWWVNSVVSNSSGVDSHYDRLSIGAALDKWDGQDGITQCNGDSDSQPGWIDDALTFFGVNIRSSDRGNRDQTLAELGYTCKTPSGGGDKTCTNNNATGSASTKGSILNIIANLPYLKGSSLSKSSLSAADSEKYAAVTYWAALQDYTNSKLCGASPGDISNVSTISVVNDDGTLTSKSYSSQSGSIGAGASEVPLNATDGRALLVGVADSPLTSCSDIAKLYLNASYAGTYAAYVHEATCAKNYSDTSQAAACVDGAAHTGQLNYCTTTYSDSKNTYQGSTLLVNQPLRLACYAGQGNQGEEACVVDFKYTDANGANPGLQECINGAQNSDPTYCATKYQDYYQGSTLVNNSASRKACANGQLNPAVGLISAVSASKCPSGETGTPPNCVVTAPSCAIPNVGWIVCPIVTFMATANDGLIGVLSGLLTVDTSIISNDPSNGAYNAWEAMRNIANVGLVIVFMIIIFSQISSVGISNYGVKKMLPRLVIAALLINLSFLICQVAVDLSNILGGSISPLFGNIPVFGQASSGPNSTATLGGQVLSGGIAIGAVAAGTTAAVIAGSLLVPVLVAALLAVFVTVMIIAARKVVIILLVVVAPLAFLAMLLPNTEGLFKQWRKILIAMLIIYPEVALLFAGSTLASNIITASKGADANALQEILGIIVTFVPLLVTPALLQSSLKAVPALGNFASSLAKRANSNVSKSANKRLRPELDKYLSRRSAGLGWNGKERVKRGFIGERLDKDGNPTGRRGLFGAKLAPKTTTHEEEIKKLDKDGKYRGRKEKITVTSTAMAAQQAGRNFGQVLGQRGMLTEKDVAKNKALAEARYGSNSFADREGNYKNRTGRAAGAIRDQTESAKLEQSSVDEIYKARLKTRQLQEGSADQRITAQMEDAEATTKLFDAQLKDHQSNRIMGNAENTAAAAIGVANASEVLTIGHGAEARTTTAELGNLGDLNKATFAAEGTAAATEKEIESRNERSGISDAATRRTQIATQQIENVHNKEKDEFEQSLQPGGENARLGAETIIGEVAGAKTKAERERIKNEARLGVNQQNPDGSGGTYFKENELNSIFATDQDTIAANEAATWAEGGTKIKYGAEIDSGSERGKELGVAASGAKFKRADGSQMLDDDGNEQISKIVQAKASKIGLDDDTADEDVIVSLAKTKTIGLDTALARIGLNEDGTPMDPDKAKAVPDRAISDAEKRGYYKYIVQSADETTIQAATTYIGSLPAQVKAKKEAFDQAKARVDAIKARGGTPSTTLTQELDDKRKAYEETDKYAKRMQTLYLESPMKPPWVGGQDKGKLSKAEFDSTNEEAAMISFIKGKVSGRGFSTANIVFKGTMSRILERGDMTDKQIEEMKAEGKSDEYIAAAKKAAAEALLKRVALKEGMDEEEAKKGLAKNLIAIDQAEFQPELNGELQTRDSEQFKLMREGIKSLTPGIVPKIATGRRGADGLPEEVEYRGYGQEGVVLPPVDEPEEEPAPEAPATPPAPRESASGTATSADDLIIPRS